MQWQWRRRNYLIDKDFQLRYVGRSMFGIMVMALVVAFTVYYTTWAKIMDEFYNVPQIASQFAPLFASVNRTLLLVLLLFLVIAAVISVFASHSIAGPVYRFEKTFQAIMKGDLTPKVGLRKTDEFRHLAETINQTLNGLRENLSADRELISEMAKLSKKIQESGTPAKNAGSLELTKDWDKLNQMLNKLQQAISRFKL